MHEEVRREPYAQWHVLDRLKTWEMCNEAMCDNPAVFFLVPDRFKTQELCIKAVEVDPCQLKDVLEHFKTQEMYDHAVWGALFLCNMSWITL